MPDIKTKLYIAMDRISYDFCFFCHYLTRVFNRLVLEKGLLEIRLKISFLFVIVVPLFNGSGEMDFYGNRGGCDTADSFFA